MVSSPQPKAESSDARTRSLLHKSSTLKSIALEKLDEGGNSNQRSTLHEVLDKSKSRQQIRLSARRRTGSLVVSEPAELTGGNFINTCEEPNLEDESDSDSINELQH